MSDDVRCVVFCINSVLFLGIQASRLPGAKVPEAWWASRRLCGSCKKLEGTSGTQIGPRRRRWNWYMGSRSFARGKAFPSAMGVWAISSGRRVLQNRNLSRNQLNQVQSQMCPNLKVRSPILRPQSVCHAGDVPGKNAASSCPVAMSSIMFNRHLAADKLLRHHDISRPPVPNSSGPVRSSRHKILRFLSDGWNLDANLLRWIPHHDGDPMWGWSTSEFEADELGELDELDEMIEILGASR